MGYFLLYFLLTHAVFLLVNVNGQYPPRLSIPGAFAVSTPAIRPQLRNEKVVHVRSRPTALRSQNVIGSSLPHRLLEEAKPVTEAPEEEDNLPDAFLPSLLREQQLAQAQQTQFQQTAAAFLNNDNPSTLVDTPTSSIQFLQPEEPVVLPTLPRFQERPQPAKAISTRPAVFNDYGIGAGISASRYERPQPAENQAPILHNPQPASQRVNIVRSRPGPAREQQRPQYEAQVHTATAAPVPQRPRPKPIQPRPAIEHNQVQHEYNRRQKPVAQTIRKWREENEDGSITWGYENDDGSFKEEIIGTDCITKGTYGYIDPDGNKREYHYETGIKCDPNTRETEEELQANGFINYEENKAVLPNGIEIDMSQLGKKKSKRPIASLRN